MKNPHSPANPAAPGGPVGSPDREQDMNTAEAVLAFEALSASRIYQDYAAAFTRGTGLPLTLHGPDSASAGKGKANAFCAAMAKSNATCAACHALQREVEQAAHAEPATLRCYAGLCETAVPIRAGNRVIAFLRTGQVLLEPPSRTKFKKLARTLLEWGAKVDLRQAEEAWLGTRVLGPAQYDSLIRLLEIFAGHLSSCAGALVLAHHPPEPPAIAQARQFILIHAEDELSLNTVAHAVNMSASYFSEKFKQAAGMNFVEYVARTRAEKARELLRNPRLRISEIAFAVGFQSLSQFNRVFKRITGLAPRAYRESLAGEVAEKTRRNSRQMRGAGSRAAGD